MGTLYMDPVMTISYGSSSETRDYFHSQGELESFIEKKIAMKLKALLKCFIDKLDTTLCL
jgi:hypothetical protein